MNSELLLNGRSLDVEKIWYYLRSDEEVKISSDSLQTVQKYRKKLQAKLERGEQIYGSTTGFGVLSRKRIKFSEMQELQKNLVRSHAAGAGMPMRDDVVKVSMLAKLNSLLRGNSCVRPEIVETLEVMLNKGIVPVIPSYGSLGASGDLAPSAYIALAMTGEGEVKYKGAITSAAKAFADAGINAIELQPKEGLSLLNGTCFTTALACLATIELKLLLDWGNCCVALAAEALNACRQSFDIRLSNMRGIEGQTEVTKMILKLLEGSRRLRDDPIPQDPYSVRCAPQVHGAVFESYMFARKIIDSELNSITDNPVMSEDGEILHGGNFHAQPIAMVLDLLSISSSYIAELSLARIHKLMELSISKKRDYYASRPGLESGLMLTEYLAVALNNMNSVLLHPSSSYPANVSAGVEDHASHGVNSGLKTLHILSNVSRIISIELLALSNLFGMNEDGIADASRITLNLVRKFSPLLEGDRSMGKEIEKLAEEIRSIAPPVEGRPFSLS